MGFSLVWHMTNAYCPIRKFFLMAIACSVFLNKCPRQSRQMAQTELLSSVCSSSSPSSFSYYNMSSPSVIFTEQQLNHVNAQLERLSPQDILRWAIITFPGLVQTTAFGLTGLVTADMLSRIDLAGKYPVEKSPVDLVFVDTLHHFAETYDLVRRVQARYPNTSLHVYYPEGTSNEEEFSARYGANLWQTDEDLYDYLVKVEPVNRAYAELGVTAALTGRRRSQGGARSKLPIVEIEQPSGLIKINPLATWSFAQVKAYIDKHNVPYNSLLDKGYRSIGDWHSTVPVAEGDDERAGRWRGRQKSECGIHEASRFAQYLASRS